MIEAKKPDSLSVTATKLTVCTCILVVAGCTQQEPAPRIVYSPAGSEPVLAEPAAPRVKPESGEESTSWNVPRAWLPPSSVEKPWTAIIVHHSATDTGNASIFDRWHREGNHWEGVGYDFVIGNGSNSGDGQVEVTFRWRQQRTGAHCRTPGNWANEDAVGICLVGNFNKDRPTARQKQSVLKLVRFLQKRYRIPKTRIYGHNTTPGARPTDCPGRNFPMAWLKSSAEG